MNGENRSDEFVSHIEYAAELVKGVINETIA